ncbi:hypothetical protein N0V88_006311 [Collariella sp. IMI 366227]|nr:hypothetical protein N0V88_006311 [Collariella sp. IMI 366227]
MRLPQASTSPTSRAASSLPAGRALLLCTLLWLLIFTYGKLFLWRDPHSAYFSSDGVYDLDYSAARQRQAREYIQRVERDVVGDTSFEEDGRKRKQYQKTGDTPALCAAFVTVRRKGEQARWYMQDALGSMLAELDVRERGTLNVSLLFSNMDPARHPDWDAPVGEEWKGRLQKAEEERDLQLKGVFDYLYVLERCLEETSAPFVAVFEDDVVFAADWMARTMRGLQYLVKDYKPAEGEKDWLYMRLFYTETHMGWSAEGDWWYNHLPLTLLMGAVGAAAVLVALRLVGCGKFLWLDWASIALVSLVMAPAFVVLMFMAGKHNLPVPGFSLHHNVPLSSTGGVVPMDKNGCCTQALVFNRPALPKLIEYLRKRERGQTDSMIEDYCGENGVKRFALREQAVQHVGLVSSRGMRAIDAQSVWAFWFEANRPAEVEKRHRQTVEDVDWDMFNKLASPGSPGV